MRPSRAGFTLFEVLAAVAIVGFAFTMLARANIEGLRAEGTAAHRLRASLVADRVLAEMETGLNSGAAPPVGRQEAQNEDFLVTVEVAALDLGLPVPEVADLPAPLLDASGGPSLLATQGGTDNSALRTIDITVAWEEGSSSRSVTRRTFAFDSAAVSGLLESVNAAVEAQKAQ